MENENEHELTDEIRNKATASAQGMSRFILESYFDWHPRLEPFYRDGIKTDPHLFDLFKRWVLKDGMLTDMYSFRESEYRWLLAYISTDKKRAKQISYFILDALWGWLYPKMVNTFSYYCQIEITQEVLLGFIREDSEFGESVASAVFKALQLFCSEYPRLPRNREYIFADFFACTLVVNLVEMLPNFEEVKNNDEFKNIIEQEWAALLPYRDFSSGFSIVPKIAPEALVRYLHLPDFKEFSGLRKEKTYREINEYLIALAVLRPQPVVSMRQYFQKEVIELYRPLIRKILKQKQHDKALLSGTSTAYENEFIKEAQKILADFEPFYKSFGFKSLKKLKVDSDKDVLKEEVVQKFQDGHFMPFGLDGRLIKHQMIGEVDKELPFSAFLQHRILDLADKWFEGDSILDKKSWSKNAGMDVDADSFRAPDAVGLPNYDFYDKEGLPVGWLPLTFAGIVNLSQSTLKRWRKEGLLIGVASGQKHKRFGSQYRFYVKADIAKAKDIKLLKEKRKSTKGK